MTAELPSQEETSPAINRQTLWLAALLLLVVAGSLRFVNLGGPSFWEDEVYTYISSADLIPQHLQWQGARAFPHPPMIYLEAKIARVALGNSEFAMRTPAALWGIATVLGLFVLVGRHVNWGVGFVAALIFAVHPAVLEWSRDARMYSQWLGMTVLLIALTLEAWRHARGPDSCPLDWRWWLLGIVFMFSHVYAMFALTTIAAVGLWLGMMALLEFKGNRRATMTILFGSALAAGVYLCSWALPGIGSILARLGHPGHDHVDIAAELAAVIAAAIDFFGGYLANPLSIAFIAVGLVGLIGVAFTGRARFAVLVSLIAIFAWGTFPSVIKQHFYAPRYVIVGMIGLAIGWGWCLNQLWCRKQLPALMARRGLAAAIMAGLIAGWAGPDYHIMTKARADFDSPIANIKDNAKPGDLVICYPEWYAEMRAWYKFGDHVKIATPPEALLAGSQPVSQTGLMIRGHDITFEDVFRATQKDDSTNAEINPGIDTEQLKKPDHLWILIVSPYESSMGNPHMDQLRKLFAACEFDSFEKLKALIEADKDVMVLSCRVDRAGISQVVTTKGRDSYLK